MDRYLGLGKVLFLAGIALVYLLFLAPWNKGIITVTGSSKMDQAPQIATFYATVTVSDDDKQKAVDLVNSKMTELLASLKSFGIPEADIQTAQVSVSENQNSEILVYPPRDLDVKKWTATNSITIKLRDTAKASGLADLLNVSGATNVSGPNFTIEDTKASDAKLLAEAVADAKTKALSMAKAGGRILGKMTSVMESGGIYPYPMALTAEKASGVPIEPGVETLTKSVTVTFELW